MTPPARATRPRRRARPAPSSRGTLPTTALAGLACALALGAGGCATVRSLDGPIADGRPLVMGGTRANLAALRRWELAADGPGPAAEAPPTGPLLDLLPSAALDVLALGVTVPTAALLAAFAAASAPAGD